MRVRIKALPRVVSKIQRLAREGGDRNASGTRIFGEMILTDSNASGPGHGVPVDIGTLRGSGRVDGPDVRGKSTVSYGGAAAPYALRQHEELQYQHKIGEARWLIRSLERLAGSGAIIEVQREQADAAIQAAKRA